jgi:hypothetical protein
MWPVSAAFLAAIQQSHQVTSRVELWYGATRLDDDLAVVAGDVSGQRSQIRRTMSLTITASTATERRNLWEQVALPGVEVRAFRGVRFLDGSQVEIPLGVFVTQQPKIDEATGTIQFGTCNDRMQRVIDYTFESPRTASAGFTYAQQIQQLIGEAVSGLAFVDLSGNGDAVPAAIWESDRAGAVTQLATAIGCDIGFDASGAAVLQRTKALSDPADWSISPTTNMVSAAAQIDWSNAANVVVARGDQTDGTPPVFGIARDTDPTSPTYWRGPMGPKTKQYSSPLLTSNTMAGKAAATILARSTGAQKTIDLTTISNAALDVGDRVDAILLAAGWAERHLLDSFKISLTGASMAIGTRATGTAGATDA